MILESAQLLSTAHRILDGELIGKKYVLQDETRELLLYKTTHVNHPSAIWVRESDRNYKWLYDHFVGLCEEYKFRYGKTHLTEKKLKALLYKIPNNIPRIGMTPIKCAMKPEFIISDDPIQNYRNYYKLGKKHLFNWTDRKPPQWLEIINN